MSTGIAAANWPSNMSADDRKVWLLDQIRIWVGEKRIEECFSALELGNLSMTEKAVAYRSVLIIGSIKHCRKHKRVEARIPILTLITYLSDNAKGTCFVTIGRMAELFDRSRQCIIDNILALEEDGLIGVARVDGMMNCYWPRIPSALKDMSPNPAWVIEALTAPTKVRIFGNIDDAIASAIEGGGNQSTGVDQSSRVDGCQPSGVDGYRSTGVDPTSQVQQGNQSSRADQPVKSSTDSISSLNLFSPSQGVSVGKAVGTTPKLAPHQGNGPGLPPGKRTWRAPSLAPRAAHEAEHAFVFYNGEAERHGYVKCPCLTPPLRKRLESRLEHIRGLEQFQRAVLAIQLDDFLSGRVRHAGRKPFQLDLERLLQTDGNMGDVLVRLLGLADQAARSSGAGGNAQASREALTADLERVRRGDGERTPC